MENISNAAFIVLCIIGFMLIVIVVAAIIFQPVNKEIKRMEAKAKNNTVNFQGLEITAISVKCPKELCKYRRYGKCTHDKIDLYDRNGICCKNFESISVINDVV